VKTRPARRRLLFGRNPSYYVPNNLAERLADPLPSSPRQWRISSVKAG
jgi:hypothetical protein